MEKHLAPVVVHREWRFLLRAFTQAHRAFQGAPNKVLQFGLSPAASVARWLLTEQPHLLEREELTLLLPGASTVEGADDGRWFSFLPWLVGRPNLKFKVWLVGDELKTLHVPHEDSMIRGRDNSTPAAALVARLPRASLFDGELSAWRQAEPQARVDACILFSPGFSRHYETWLREEDLLPYFRANTPVALFCYSKLDALEDQETLKLLGFQFTVKSMPENPWRLSHEMQSLIGAFGQYPWGIQDLVVPSEVDFSTPALAEFMALQDYVKFDFETLGADIALARLGSRHPLQRAGSPGQVEHLIMLPRETGYLESTRQAGFFDRKGFTPFEPALLIPEESLQARPAETDDMARILWAIRLHRDVLAPMLAERERRAEHPAGGLFEGAGMGDLEAGFKALAKAAGLPDDVDFDDFMRQMRLNGGIHGSPHPSWHDMLSSLGWPLQDYLDEPDRFEPAFYTSAPRHAPGGLPVVCESYAYFPDDDEDDLCLDAQDVLESEFPDGVVLLFRNMPFTEVAGHKYNFGGLIYWKGQWRAYALNERMTSVDEVIDQVEAGFTFDNVSPVYADECLMAAALNLMCFGMDPNQKTRLSALRQRRWVTVVPS